MASLSGTTRVQGVAPIATTRVAAAASAEGRRVIVVVVTAAPAAVLQREVLVCGARIAAGLRIIAVVVGPVAEPAAAAVVEGPKVLDRRRVRARWARPAARTRARAPVHGVTTDRATVLAVVGGTIRLLLALTVACGRWRARLEVR